MNNKVNGKGLSRIFKAYNCSINGFKAAYINEAAFRQELMLCAVLVPLSLLISDTLADWVQLICSLLFLLFAEVINSALEALADRVSLEQHELIGRAKDLGSAGVFIAMVIVVLTWFSALYSFLF